METLGTEWIVTEHAVTRFAERSPRGFSGKDRPRARPELARALETAAATDLRSPNDNAMRHLAEHDLYVVVTERQGRLVALTVLTAEQARVLPPRVGPNTAERPGLTSGQIAAQLAVAQEEAAAAAASCQALKAALKRGDPAGVPAEYWDACVRVTQSAEARQALLHAAQAENARHRETEKTLRHAASQDVEQKLARRNAQVRAVLVEAFAAGSLAEAYAIIERSPSCGSLLDGVPSPAAESRHAGRPAAWPERVLVEHAVRVELDFKAAELAALLRGAPSREPPAEATCEQIRVGAARESLGLSRRELAKRLSVPYSSYCCHERSNRLPETAERALREMLSAAGTGGAR